jgi:hypothetical protein
VIFLSVAVLLGVVVAVARSRAIEVDAGRAEADRATASARVWCRADGLCSLPAPPPRWARAWLLPV